MGKACAQSNRGVARPGRHGWWCVDRGSVSGLDRDNAGAGLGAGDWGGVRTIARQDWSRNGASPATGAGLSETRQEQ